MNGGDEWRLLLREIVAADGEITDLARAVRLHFQDSDYTQRAAALVQEFGLKTPEGLAAVGCAEGSIEDEESLAL